MFAGIFRYKIESLAKYYFNMEILVKYSIYTGCLLAVIGTSTHAENHGPDVDRFPAQSLVEQFEEDFSAAQSNTEIRPMIPVATELIKHFEGWFPKAYDDPAGYCTIGYGHLLALKQCSQTKLGAFADGLSLDQGEILLLEDSREARKAVQSLVKSDLTDEQFGALSSFVFNVGVGNFSKSTILKLLNIEEYDRASLEFQRWVRAKGQVLPGLQVRRGCEAALFVGQLKLGDDRLFDRSQCIELGAAPTAGDLIDIETGEF